MIPVSIVTGWISEVTYVAALSLWALVSGHWSAWQAARVEVQQAEEMEKRDREDIPGEIVERVVEETEVDKQTDIRDKQTDIREEAREPVPADRQRPITL